MSTTSRTVAEMVDRQVRKWEVESQYERQEHLPVISVSREYGSRGADFARVIANRAGFDFWDQELVHRMAEESGVADRLVETLDEHARGALFYVFPTRIGAERFSEEQYRSQLLKILKTIAQHGAAVVVGRGANFVLGARHAFRLRVVAPVDARVRGLVEREGMSEDEARTTIDRVDRERARFMSHHFLRDVTDPTAYDLTVNGCAFSDERIADVVLAGYEAKFGLSIAR